MAKVQVYNPTTQIQFSHGFVKHPNFQVSKPAKAGLPCPNSTYGEGCFPFRSEVIHQLMPFFK